MKAQQPDRQIDRITFKFIKLVLRKYFVQKKNVSAFICTLYQAFKKIDRRSFMSFFFDLVKLFEFRIQ